jgi:hypothetical protein
MGWIWLTDDISTGFVLRGIGEAATNDIAVLVYNLRFKQTQHGVVHAIENQMSVAWPFMATR